MRYNSTPVRVVSALIGVITVFPWLVLGFQSLGLVFSYLSFGLVTPVQAVFVGIAVLAVRQIWTVRMGMRGIVISDMVQGIFAYGVGTTIALGLMVWLVGQGATLADLPSDFAKLPGPGSDLGPMYFFSIVLTGALGAWCWPDIFVRLFTARTASTIKRSAVKAAPVVVIFCAALLTLSMLASQLPEVAGAPDNVWFLTASHGGALVLALAGVCVLAATMGNANALNSAIGTHLAQDVIHVRGASDERMTRTAKLVILVVTVLAVIGATATATTTTGLVTLGLVSYQGVVQLAPSLYLGIFWRRGNAAGALVGMVVGFALAAVLEYVYQASIRGPSASRRGWRGSSSTRRSTSVSPSSGRPPRWSGRASTACSSNSAPRLHPPTGRRPSRWIPSRECESPASRRTGLDHRVPGRGESPSRGRAPGASSTSPRTTGRRASTVATSPRSASSRSRTRVGVSSVSRPTDWSRSSRPTGAQSESVASLVRWFGWSRASSGTWRTKKATSKRFGEVGGVTQQSQGTNAAGSARIPVSSASSRSPVASSVRARTLGSPPSRRRRRHRCTCSTSTSSGRGRDAPFASSPDRTCRRGRRRRRPRSPSWTAGAGRRPPDPPVRPGRG